MGYFLAMEDDMEDKSSCESSMFWMGRHWESCLTQITCRREAFPYVTDATCVKRIKKQLNICSSIADFLENAGSNS